MWGQKGKRVKIATVPQCQTPGQAQPVSGMERDTCSTVAFVGSWKTLLCEWWCIGFHVGTLKITCCSDWYALEIVIELDIPISSNM